MEFTAKIRRLLKMNRLSQADLAGSLGTTQQQVSRWLESNTPPKAAYLLKLARALGVTADYLIDDALDAPPPAEAGPTADERFLLQLIRDMGIGREEAVRRLTGEPGGTGTGKVKVLGDRNTSEAAAREEKEREEKEREEKEREERRLGFEFDQQGQVVAERPDDRPLPRDRR